MELIEKTLRETEAYQGRILRFHVDEVELRNGKTSTRECVEHPGGASVAVLTEKDAVCPPVPLPLPRGGFGSARRKTGKGRRSV